MKCGGRCGGSAFPNPNCWDVSLFLLSGSPVCTGQLLADGKLQSVKTHLLLLLLSPLCSPECECHRAGAAFPLHVNQQAVVHRGTALSWQRLGACVIAIDDDDDG